MATKTIDHGYISVAGIGGGPFFQLFGPNVLLTNRGADQGNCSPQSASPAQAGTHSLAASFFGGFGLGSGYAEVGTTAYQKLYYTGTIKIAGSVALVNTTLSQIVVVGAFKMKGNLKAYTTDPTIDNPGDPVFDSAIAGVGKAILELTTMLNNNVRIFEFVKVTYQFLG